MATIANAYGYGTGQHHKTTVPRHCSSGLSATRPYTFCPSLSLRSQATRLKDNECPLCSGNVHGLVAAIASNELQCRGHTFLTRTVHRLKDIALSGFVLETFARSLFRFPHGTFHFHFSTFLSSDFSLFTFYLSTVPPLALYPSRCHTMNIQV